MNERQAKNQQRLQSGKQLGQDSSVDSKNNDTSEGGADNSSGEKKITQSVFFKLLTVLLILDIIGLIPFIGWAISTVASLLIFRKFGVKFHYKNIMKVGTCDLVKVIPGVSLIPTFVMSGILTIGPMVSGLGEGIPGGQHVANKVQKAISMTKK